MKDPYPVLVYEAVFEKKKNAKIKATFVQEGKKYQLFALTFVNG